MDDSKVYLSFGRHGRYGHDTAIEHMSMLESFLGGRTLAAKLPSCDTIYYSPIPRAVMTARFQGLGMRCRHFLESKELEEDMSTFVVRKFVDNIIQCSTAEDRHYHFVTHQPIIEKLGLPELDTCGICFCVAENWQEMLAENYEIFTLPRPTYEELSELMQKLRIEPEDLEKFSPNGVYSALSRL